MAAGKEDVNIRLTGTDAGASKAVSSVARELTQLQSAASPLAGAMGRLDDMSRKLSASQHGVADASGRASTSLKASAAQIATQIGLWTAVVTLLHDTWAAFKQFADVGDLADKLGVMPEELQKIAAAGAPAGVSMQSLATAMQHLEKNLGNVENKKAAEALARFGVTAEQLTRLPLDEKLLLLAEGFQRAQLEGTGTADIMALLGKGGKDLTAVLQMSQQELAALMHDVKIISDADIAAMDAMSDRIDKLIDKTKKFGAESVLFLVDQIESIATFTGQFLNPIGLVHAAGSKMTGQTNAFEDLTDERLARDTDVDNVASRRWAQKLTAARKLAEEKARVEEEIKNKALLKEHEAEVKAFNKTAAEKKKLAEKAAEDEAKAQEKAVKEAAEEKERREELGIRNTERKRNLGIGMASDADRGRVLQEALDSVIASEPTMVHNSKDIMGMIGLNEELGNTDEVDRLLDLLEDVRSLEKQITAEKERQTEEEEEKNQSILTARGNYLTAEDDLLGMRQDFAQKEAGTIVADSMTEIGGGGGLFTPAMDESRAQLTAMEDCRDYLKDIYESMAGGGGGIGVAVP
jgi:hypothetical protein